MQDNIAKFQFTNSEFIMLSMILGTAGLIGIPDPDGISTMDEIGIKKKWTELKVSLTDKQFIQEDNEDSLLINEAVYNIVQQYINAHKMLELQISEKGEQKKDQLYFFSESGNCCLSLDVKEENYINAYTDGYEVQVMEAVKYFCKSLPAHDPKDKAAYPVVLNKNQYFEFMAAMNMGDHSKAVDLFARGGIEEDIAEDAILGFVDKNCFINISFSDMGFNIYDDEPITEIQMFYLGKNHIYSITTSEEDDAFFQVQALTMTELLSSIEAVIHSKLA